MNALTIEAPAKINLYLAVGPKRPDGYHEITSVMQQIGLYDLVSVTRSPRASGKKIAVHCSDPAVPSDSRNIVWKCAEAFFEAFGIGERIAPLAVPAPSYAVLVAFPGGGISTREAYRLLDEHPAPPAPAPDVLLDELLAGGMPRSLFNDFERVILPRHPGAPPLKDRMTALGASSVLMSGSGPAVFGLFPALSDARSARDALLAEGIPAWAAKPL